MRDVLVIISRLFFSYGVVLNTTIGISDNITRLIELAILTFTSAILKFNSSSSCSIIDTIGLVILLYIYNDK